MRTAGLREEPQTRSSPLPRKEDLNAIFLLSKAGSLEAFIFSDQVGLPLPIPFLNFLTSFFQSSPLVGPGSSCKTGSVQSVTLCVCVLQGICVYIQRFVFTRGECAKVIVAGTVYTFKYI